MSNRRALISVSNKDGVLAFAEGLAARGYEILSTGGTARSLQQAGLQVTAVSDVTGVPEMMDGRVKTLHPAIHAGLLAVRSNAEHMASLEEQGIRPIDLVCINLYPFSETVARPGVQLNDAIENIDIGGPSMIRSAAKNAESVTVVVDPSDYPGVLAEIAEQDGDTTLRTRRRLAVKAFALTAQYDAQIAAWLGERASEPAAGNASRLPSRFQVDYELAQVCRYGENPHQQAAFYVASSLSEPCIGNARQVHGRELSFNNVFDINAALEAVKEFSENEQPAAVIIKHTNPCGAALGATLADAVRKARAGDPVSAFGGILAVSRRVDEAAAEEITARSTFLEAIIAPGFAPDALRTIQERKGWGPDVRILECGDLRGWRGKSGATGLDFKRVVGGVLAQTPDHLELTRADLRVVSERAPTSDEIEEMLFAWRVVKHVKSNAIVLSAGRSVVGVGAGQMNRVQSVRLATGHAGERARGAVLASDAFFPFPDGPEAAAEAGVTAFAEPGGSKKDEDVIQVCNRYGVALVFTGVRHFLH